MVSGSGFVYKRGGGYFGQDPPTQLWTHPPNFGPSQTPPPLIILWGAFFVNQIEAKALSRFRHPQRVELQLRSLTTGLPTSSDSDVQQRVHRFNMLSKKRPPCEKLPPAHLPPAQRHNRKGHQQTARQGSCDQRKKVWQEPNPGNSQNYKRGGGSRALDPPTCLKTHPPRPPPHCNLILINEAWSGWILFVCGDLWMDAVISWCSLVACCYFLVLSGWMPLCNASSAMVPLGACMHCGPGHSAPT